MYTLIKRDFFIAKPTDYIGLFLLLTFTHYISLSPYFLFMTVLIGFIVSFHIYDHYYKVNRIFISLPIAKKTLILSRYLSSLLLMSFLLLYQLIFLTIAASSKYSILYYMYTWKDIIILFSIGTITIGMISIIFYFFKSLYTSIVIISVLYLIGIILVMKSVFAELNHSDFIDLNALDGTYLSLIENTLPGPAYMLLLPATSFCIGSYYLSLYLFKRKNLA